MRNHALRAGIGNVGGGGGGGGGGGEIPIAYVGGNYASNVSGSSLSVPAHNDGDLIIYCGTSRESASPPDLIAGYTNIGTIVGDNGGNRIMRVSYIISDGTISSITNSGAYYKGCYLFRNASVGASAFRYGGSAGTSHAMPAIPALNVADGTSWVFGGFFYIIDAGIAMTKTSGVSGGAYVSEVSSFAETAFTSPLTAQQITASIELTRN